MHLGAAIFPLTLYLTETHLPPTPIPCEHSSITSNKYLTFR